MDVIYADNNATTRIAPEVYEAMVPYLTEQYFNPSSLYGPAHTVASAIGEARETIARFLGGVDPDEVLFTSCASESNNSAIFGALLANRERRHVITTGVEHPAVREVCIELERRGLSVTFLPVNERAELDVYDFVRALRRDTLLVSVMHANNETGVVYPVDEMARITKETDPAILFHTDATQSVGKLPVDLRGNFQNVDMLSFSGHKLHAPKGVGALYIKKGIRWRPYLIGGHQEKSQRAGTENVPYVIGLARACELARENHDEDYSRMEKMRDRLETELEKRIPYVQVNGRGAPRLPNTLNISVHYIEGEGILYQLDAHGICASSGSACTSGSLEPSHVLRAMKIPFSAVHGSVRFSLSRYNTDSEIDTIIDVFPEIVANLRKLSPYWDSVKNEPRVDAEKRMAGGPGQGD